jgi:hypothetical protein
VVGGAVEEAANTGLGDPVQDLPVQRTPRLPGRRLVATHQGEHHLVRTERPDLEVGVENGEELLGTAGPPVHGHDQALVTGERRIQLDLHAGGDDQPAVGGADCAEDSLRVRVRDARPVGDPAGQRLEQPGANHRERRIDLDEVTDEHRKQLR